MRRRRVFSSIFAATLAVAGLALPATSASAATGGWAQQNSTGIPGDASDTNASEFLFGESCPPSATGTTICFLVGDESHANSVANQGDIFKATVAVSGGPVAFAAPRLSARATPSGNPGNWLNVGNTHPNGPGLTAISCVDAAPTGPNSDYHCYAVGQNGEVRECRGQDAQLKLGASTFTGTGNCDGSPTSTDPLGGLTWDTLTTARGRTLYGVRCFTKSQCIAVGADGTILRTANANANNSGDASSAATWTDFGPDTAGLVFLGLECPDSSTCYAGGGTPDPTTPTGWRGAIYQVITGFGSGSPAPSATVETIGPGGDVTGAVNGVACTAEAVGSTSIDCFGVTDTKIIERLYTSGAAATTGTWTSQPSNTVGQDAGGGLGIGCLQPAAATPVASARPNIAAAPAAADDCSAVGYGGNIQTLVNGTWSPDAFTGYTPAATPEYDAINCAAGSGSTSVTRFCHVLSLKAPGNDGTPKDTGILGRSVTATAPIAFAVTGVQGVSIPAHHGTPSRVTAARNPTFAAATAGNVPRLPRAGAVPRKAFLAPVAGPVFALACLLLALAAVIQLAHLRRRRAP